MRELIVKKSSNIGSLILFLKNPKNKEYVDLINSSIPVEVVDESLVVKVWYFLNGFQSRLVCGCGSPLKFIGFKNGFRKTCGSKLCVVEKRKSTNLEVYGVDNPKKSDEVISREQEKIREKWGGSHFMKDQSVKSKFTDTMVERHGVEWAQQNLEIREKSRISWEENPDRVEIVRSRSEKIISKSESEKEEIEKKKKETISKNFGDYGNFIKYRLDKIREKSLDKYGTPHHMSSKEVLSKRIESYRRGVTEKIVGQIGPDYVYIGRKPNTNNTDFVVSLSCIKCGSDFDINRQYLSLRSESEEDICLVCNPILSDKSNMEKEISDFVSKYVFVETNKKIQNVEIDIFVPELKIGFEFNGLYWHSELYKDRNFHLDKSRKMKDLGIRLIHIWEDDWIFRKEIVKSVILSKIGKIPEMIFARKCEVREVTDNRIVKSFLEKNHLQGFVGSKYKIGLFHEEELVSLMTFGSPRKVLNQKNKSGVYELLRFCCKTNTSVIGGPNRMLKFFIRNFNPSEIFSYSDSSRSDGDVYQKMGFSLSHSSIPNYSWVVSGIRKHRFNFRKDKLVKNGGDPSKTEVEIMHENGHYRIFDCGVKKWRKKIG
jgi:hypothetical protein